ncbi:MAG: peptidylprolyl isomerase [Paludibacteraceae bacterium]|nr:peptidylprolyl isomerase [Paludibacteraceae bacterium]
MKRILLLAAFLPCMMLAKPDVDAVVMSIDGKPVYRSEFKYIYNKNNTGSVLDKKSKEDYKDLFIKFRLKVAEAESQGLDTTVQFVSELATYREQLARPYMTDSVMLNQILHETYDRMQSEIEVSHIAVQVTDQDTVAAYAKIMEAYDRLAGVPAHRGRGGKMVRARKPEDFATVAQQVSTDEQSARNGGYLGWITAMRTVYSFENAAYETSVGTYSQPFRTPYGYHIIKVHARRPAQGEVHVQHIMIFTDRQNDSVNQVAAQRIDSLYQAVKSGADFAETARLYSQDHGSSINGGELPWFGTGRMVPEFEHAAFALRDEGDISAPVRSQYGWHIIRLLGKRPLGTYDELRVQLAQMIERDDMRGKRVDDSFFDRCKAEFGYSFDQASWKLFADSVLSLQSKDDEFVRKAKAHTQPLMLIGGAPRSAEQFVQYVRKHNTADMEVTEHFLTQQLEGYVKDELRKQKIEALMQQNADYRNLMNEYHDGILLFEVSNREVWERAQQDSTGLDAFFRQHKDRYTWSKPYFKGEVVYCSSAEVADIALKFARNSSIEDLIPNLELRLNNDSVKAVRGMHVLVGTDDHVVGDNELIKENILSKKNKAGKRQVIVIDNPGRTLPTSQYPKVLICGRVITSPEDFSDVRGVVTTDYQEELEQQWVEQLRQKHVVVINEDVWQEMLNE